MGDKSTETKDEGNWTLERWLYIGKYWVDKKKEGDRFQVIDDETGLVTDEIKSFDKTKYTFTIGSVYEVQVLHRPEGGISAKLYDVKRLRVYEDSDFVNLLMAKNKIFKDERREKQLQNKYNNGFEVPEDFAEIQKIYNKLGYSERLVFERLVIAKLRFERENKK